MEAELMAKFLPLMVTLRHEFQRGPK